MMFIGENVIPRGTWRFLEDDEVILEDDLIRETNPWSGSDYVDLDDFKRASWVTVQSRFAAWINSTPQNYYDFGSYTAPRIEIIRKVS